MYQRVLMSLTLTIAFSLAIFVQSTSAKPVSSKVAQQAILSEKLGGLNVTPAEYRALLIRSNSLNQKYGIGESSKPIVSEKIDGLQVPVTTAAENRALAIRSDALDRKYGLGPYQTISPVVSEKTDGLGLPPQPEPNVVSASTTGFDWSDAGIGAGAMTMAFLAMLGATLVVRHRHEHGTFAH